MAPVYNKKIYQQNRKNINGPLQSRKMRHHKEIKTTELFNLRHEGKTRRPQGSKGRSPQPTSHINWRLARRQDCYSNSWRILRKRWQIMAALNSNNWTIFTDQTSLPKSNSSPLTKALPKKVTIYWRRRRQRLQNNSKKMTLYRKKCLSMQMFKQ